MAFVAMVLCFVTSVSFGDISCNCTNGNGASGCYGTPVKDPTGAENCIYNWSCQNGYYTYPTTTQTSETSYTATCDLLDYGIEYHLNGGSWSSNNPTNPSTYNVETQTFTISTPTKTGYVFAGWCEDAALTTNCSQTKTITTGSTGDRAYYAKWSCDTGYHRQNFDFDLNITTDGTSSNYDSNTNTWEVFFGDENPEFTLGGSALCSTYNGNEPATEAQIQAGANPQQADVCWCKLTSYTDNNNTTINPSDQLWVKQRMYITPGSCRQDCADGCAEYVSNNADHPGFARQLFNAANDSCVPDAGTITYNCGQQPGSTTQTGTVPSPQSVEFGGGYDLAANSCAYAGYHFIGWNCSHNLDAGTAPQGGYTYSFDGTAANAPSFTYQVSGNNSAVTCTAQWTPITHTITVNRDGGNGAIVVNNGGTLETVSANSTTFTCNEGDTVTFPGWGADNSLTKTGYVFTGWDTSTFTCDADTTVTAQWAQCTCTDGNHSTCGNTASVSNNTCSYDFTCDTHYNYNNASGGTVPASAAGVGTVQAPDCSPITHTITVVRDDGSGDIIVNNGGTAETVSGSTFTCNDGDTVTFPDWGDMHMLLGSANSLTKTGYVFTGWDTSTFTCDADTTVTAQWAECSCTIQQGSHVVSCSANNPSVVNNTCDYNFVCDTGYNYNGASGGPATATAGNPNVTAGSCSLTTHTITFKTGSTVMGTRTCNHGTTVDVSAATIPATTTTFPGATMPVDSAYGWDFDGWTPSVTTNDALRYDTVINSVECDADVTLYGKWGRNIRFVYRASSSNQISDSVHQSYKNTDASTSGVTVVGAPNMPTFVSATNGWEPQGWYVNGSMTIVDSNSSAHSMSLGITDPDRYLGVYKRDVKISYDGNTNTGGNTLDTACTQDQYNYTGSGVTNYPTCTLANNGFTKTDYDFDTWYTNAAGTGGTSYAEGVSYTFPNNTWTSSDTVTLYAKWTPNTYNINYHNTDVADGMSWANQNDNPSTYTYGTGATIGVPLRTNYTFAGWCVGTDNCNDYANNVSGYTVTTTQTGDVDLYAQWTPNTYNINYYNTDVADGVSWANQNDNPSTYTYGTGATVGVPSRTNYTFAGWCRGTVLCYNYAGTENGYTITTTDFGDIDLYAVWIPHNVNLVWDSNGGTEINTPDSCEFGGTIENILQPTKTGYSFSGWVLKCWLPDTIVSERANAWAGRGLDNNIVHSWGGATASTYGITQPGQWGASWNSGDKVLGEAFCSTTSGTPGSTASVIEMTEGVNCWCRLTSYTSNNAEQCDVMPTIWVHNGYSYGNTAGCKVACDRACTNSMSGYDVGFRTALVGNNVASP
ncbi:MAG: InlB B-repeat-containing protein [Alphaproteobacteria bacterium]|nr:InlB B-repeat-containing protein [Alphaproteobacteria bacterium]